MISNFAVKRKTSLLLAKYHARYNNCTSEIENNTKQSTIIGKLTNNSGSTLQQKNKCSDIDKWLYYPTNIPAAILNKIDLLRTALF